LGDKISEEAFSGVNLEIRILMIFGCPVYIHVPMEKRMNLEPSGYKGIFLGYNDTSKDYKIFILVKRKIVVIRDVRFEGKLESRRS
jgi:hypothetical protein